ncbi:unnamed protein product [Camellia sinensis]
MNLEAVCFGKGKLSRSSMMFPLAQRMDTLNDLLAASDLISLHCALTNETIQIINADCLQHIKPGAFLAVLWMVLKDHNGWKHGYDE